MDKNEFIEKLADLDDEILSELNEELDEELNKTMKNRDERKIIELSNAIADIKGYTPSEEDVKRSTEAILTKLDNKVPKRMKVIKTLSTAAACLVAVVVLNQGIAYAFDVKMFPKLYEVVDGAIVIHMDQDRKETQQILSEIKGKCNEYGITTLIPTYLPENYTVTELDYIDNDLNIRLKKDDVKINIYYEFYSVQGTFGVPSDEGNVHEAMLNGHPFLISTEDNQYRAVSITENFRFVFTSHNLDYSEAEKILSSLT
ncbi:MAG TPA: hypothetical protein P5092_13740 [Ruminococcus sp.]|nr:hypothetical protein [Ruminococcus sp.]